MEQIQKSDGEIAFSVRKALNDSFIKYDSVFVSKFFINIDMIGTVFGNELNQVVAKTGYKLNAINATRKGRLHIILEL